jgi:hypothetical protein
MQWRNLNKDEKEAYKQKAHNAHANGQQTEKQPGIRA